MEDREGDCFVKVFKVHTMVRSNIHTYQLKSSQARQDNNTQKFLFPLNLAILINTRLGQPMSNKASNANNRKKFLFTLIFAILTIPHKHWKSGALQIFPP